MTKKEEINNAVMAHSMWKFRLNEAIKAKKTDFIINDLLQDNVCEFGKWLHSNAFSATEKTSDPYRNILKLHTEFHKTAAEVGNLINNDKVSEAKTIMAIGGAYNSISSQLTNAMIHWRDNMK